jgi:5-methylcytosine-specific restriction endonuclease McrA
MNRVVTRFRITEKNKELLNPTSLRLKATSIFRKPLPQLLQSPRRLKTRVVRTTKMAECFFCGKPISRKNKTRDHLLPTSRNGSNSPKNIVDACKPCNNLKGCLDLEEFRLVVAYRKGLIRKAKMLFPGELKQKRD